MGAHHKVRNNQGYAKQTEPLQGSQRRSGRAFLQKDWNLSRYKLNAILGKRVPFCYLPQNEGPEMARDDSEREVFYRTSEG